MNMKIGKLKMKIRDGLAAGLCMVALLAAASADMKLKTRTTVAGHSMDNTVLIKGARQRTEMNVMPGMNTVTIYQCDQNRILTINDRNRTYSITLLGEKEAVEGEKPAPEAGPQARPVRPSRQGGVVTYTTNMVDTGARKPMFGYTARNIKSEMSSEASGNTCSGAGKMNMKSDGWYIDLPGHAACSASSRAAIRMRPQQNAGCNDEMHFKQTGSGKIGYPVSVETTMVSDGRTFTIKQETLDLSSATLDAALFDIPAGYTEAKSAADVAGKPDIAAMMQQASSGRPGRGYAQKGAGVLRIGVVTMGDKSGLNLSTPVFREKLISQIQEMKAEAVPLDVPADATLQIATAAAREAECDYILYTDVTGGKVPTGKKKLGGFLKRATGADSSASLGDFEVALGFKLYQVGDAEVRLDSTANSVEGMSAELSAANATQNEVVAVIVQVKKDSMKRKR